MKNRKETKTAKGEALTTVPATLEDVKTALAELRDKFQSTEQDLCRPGVTESAKLWRDVLDQTEASIAAGGHADDALSLLRQRVTEARAAIGRLTADITILPELHRLEGLRLKLDGQARRRALFGVVSTAPASVRSPEPFNASMSGFTLSNAPDELFEYFALQSEPVELAAARLEEAFSDVAAAVDRIADICKPVGASAVASLHEKRRALVSALKLYILMAASVCKRIVDMNAADVVNKSAAAIEAEAARLAAEIEAKAVASGLDPAAARAAAQEAPAVRAVWARLIDPQMVLDAEARYVRMLIGKTEAARDILEREISALV